MFSFASEISFKIKSKHYEEVFINNFAFSLSSRLEC